jgi:ribosomal protein S6
MSETKMPAAEAVVTNERELVSYEFAFHVLPTVAEGEVPRVVDSLKTLITTAEGEIFDEEAPERFDLAYEIAKYMEGRNRRFSSAYFGWIRFRAEAAKLAEITEQIEHTKEMLRFMIVKLTKVEEANPFRFHESIADRKVRTIGEDDEVVEGEEVVETEEVATLEVVKEEDSKVAE